MFYDYLKSIYDIVENYKPNSDNFNNVIKANDNFIKRLNNYIDPSFSQSGGKKYKTYKVVTILSLKKSQIGGSPIDDLKKMQASMLGIVGTIHEPQSNVTQAELDSIRDRIRNFRLLLENLVRYIEYLHTLIPDDENVMKLNEQLKTIKDIAEKY